MLLSLTYLDNDTLAALATFLSTTLVYSSITTFDLIFLAKSALNFSPLDKTWYGLYHDGTELSPTELNFFMPSSGVSKCEMIDLLISQLGFCSIQNSFNNVDLPEPLEPTMIPSLNCFGNESGNNHG